MIGKPNKIETGLSRLAKAAATMAFSLGAVGLALMPAAAANARCIRQSLINHPYCGPEGNWKSAVIPERVFGDFKGSCAGHDACYSLGAEDIVFRMEQRYQQNMLGANRQQKADFSGDIARVKNGCDTQFLSGLNNACSRVDGVKRSACLQSAKLYYYAVSKHGDAAFDDSLNEAFTCRTR